MTITKIKYNGKKVQIMYRKPVTGGEPDEYSLACSDAPRREFITALEALAPYARDLCELGQDDPQRWIVKGASLSYAGENDTLGAVLILERKLHESNVNLNIVTPIKIEEFYAGGRKVGDPKQLMPQGMVDAVYELIHEAEAYVAGQRAQQLLQLPEGAK